MNLLRADRTNSDLIRNRRLSISSQGLLTLSLYLWNRPLVSDWFTPTSSFGNHRSFVLMMDICSFCWVQLCLFVTEISYTSHVRLPASMVEAFHSQPEELAPSEGEFLLPAGHPSQMGLCLIPGSVLCLRGLCSDGTLSSTLCTRWRNCKFVSHLNFISAPLSRLEDMFSHDFTADWLITPGFWR